MTGDLLSDPMLRRDGVDCNIGGVLSPDKEDLMKAVELRKKEGSSFLLLRDSILRAACMTSPYTSV